jgi:hypothetical protein
VHKRLPNYERITGRSTDGVSAEQLVSFKEYIIDILLNHFNTLYRECKKSKGLCQVLMEEEEIEQ